MSGVDLKEVSGCLVVGVDTLLGGEETQELPLCLLQSTTITVHILGRVGEGVCVCVWNIKKTYSPTIDPAGTDEISTKEIFTKRDEISHCGAGASPVLSLSSVAIVTDPRADPGLRPLLARITPLLSWQPAGWGAPWVTRSSPAPAYTKTYITPYQNLWLLSHLKSE